MPRASTDNRYCSRCHVKVGRSVPEKPGSMFSKLVLTLRASRIQAPPGERGYWCDKCFDAHEGNRK